MVARLQRTHFSTPRSAEYFSAPELEKQTGQPQTHFAAVALKELVDNALDAAETAGRPPEIGIEATVAGDALHLVVTDNGPGLATETIRRILDFSTRTSDKAAYRAPTRGLQGNAFKTVLGLPAALGTDAPVVVEAGGVRHEIRAGVDPAGNVRVDHGVTARPTGCGTRVALALPARGQRLDPGRWARGFALFNPHASVRIRDGGALDGTSNLRNRPARQPAIFTQRPSRSPRSGGSSCRPTPRRRPGMTGRHCASSCSVTSRPRARERPA